MDVARTPNRPNAGAATRSSNCWRAANRSCAVASTPASDSRIRRFSPNYARPRSPNMSAIVNRIAADGVIGEMDCFYSSWMTDRPGRLRRRRDRRAPAPDAVPRAGGEIRLARPHRRDAGRDLSRPRRRPAGSGGPHRARRRRADRGRAVVQRSAQLHAHFRHVAARADHPAAQRLCRRHRLRHSRQCRRRSETDRRRRAGDLSGAGRAARLRRRAGCSGDGAAGCRRAQRAPRRIRACRLPISISACISAKSSTATSAARSGWISPSSARRSTKSAGSPRCAAPSTSRCCSPPRSRPLSPISAIDSFRLGDSPCAGSADPGAFHPRFRDVRRAVEHPRLAGGTR